MSEDFVLIQLTRGHFAKVDACRADEVRSYRWQAVARPDGALVAQRVTPRPKKVIRMHRELVGAKSGELVDHINRDTLDNRIANLRVCSKSQNQANCCVYSRRSSMFKGVSWSKKSGKWYAKITVNGLQMSLGFFDTEYDAAMEYDFHARFFFLEFARLNFPVGLERQA